MTADIVLRDYYDFDTVDGWDEIKDAISGSDGDYDFGDLVFTNVAELHYAGMARFFYIEGSTAITRNWEGDV